MKLKITAFLICVLSIISCSNNSQKIKNVLDKRETNVVIISSFTASGDLEKLPKALSKGWMKV